MRKGEKKGLFVEKMPASIYQVKSEDAFLNDRTSEGLQVAARCRARTTSPSLPQMLL